MQQPTLHRWIRLLCTGVVGCMVHSASWAASDAGLALPTTAMPSQKAQAALQQLLTVGGSAADTAAAAGGQQAPEKPGSASGRERLVVQRGDTLDLIIRRHFRQSPFAVAFLRKAFMLLNPAAFPRGMPHLITAGAYLEVPSQQDLVLLLKAEWDGSVPHAQDWADVGPDYRQEQPSAADTSRQHWVRFP